MTRTTGPRCDPRSATDPAPFGLTSYPAYDARHTATFAAQRVRPSPPQTRERACMLRRLGDLNPEGREP